MNKLPVTVLSGFLGAGLIHRSPKVEKNEQKRLMLTLDFADDPYLKL